MHSPGPVACFSDEDDVSGNENNCYWPFHSPGPVACFSDEGDVSGNQNNCYWPLHSPGPVACFSDEDYVSGNQREVTQVTMLTNYKNGPILIFITQLI